MFQLVGAVFLAALLSACSSLTPEINKLTGTTLAERCDAYQAGEIGADLAADAFPELDPLAALDTAAVTKLCATAPATPTPSK